MLKRDKLNEIYSAVNDCLRGMDEDGISFLNELFKDSDIFRLFRKQRDLLERKDYPIIVAGN
jgi:hypothetical protein